MEIARLLSHYRSMIDLTKDSDNIIKETLIMQKYTMTYLYKDRLSECPSLRQKLYLDAVVFKDIVDSQNCKEQLTLWINHCESLGHNSNYEVPTQSWD